MKNLDQELEDYYRNKRLTPHKVAAIQASARQTGGTRSRASYLIPLAAGVVLAIGIGVWLSVGMGGGLTQRIVTEIVRNHRNQGALVVESERYGVVQTALSELDFPIRPRRDELVQAFALLGGKYCTIQGSRAAQLKLSRRDNGRVHTLYVWPMTDEAKGVEPGIYETNGVHVELWTDQLLLYGLAHGQ